jgi:hypothetical protein
MWFLTVFQEELDLGRESVHGIRRLVLEGDPLPSVAAIDLLDVVR